MRDIPQRPRRERERERERLIMVRVREVDSPPLDPGKGRWRRRSLSHEALHVCIACESQGVDSLRTLLAVRSLSRNFRGEVDTMLHAWLVKALGGPEHVGAASEGDFWRSLQGLDGWSGIKCARALRTLDRVVAIQRMRRRLRRREVGRQDDSEADVLPAREELGLRRTCAWAREEPVLKDFIRVRPPSLLGWPKVLENVVVVTLAGKVREGRDEAKYAYKLAATSSLSSIMNARGIGGLTLMRALERAFLPSQTRFFGDEHISVFPFSVVRDEEEEEGEESEEEEKEGDDDDDVGLIPLPTPLGVSAEVDIYHAQVHVAWAAMLPASHPDAPGELVVGVIGSLERTYSVFRTIAAPPWGATVAPGSWAQRELSQGDLSAEATAAMDEPVRPVGGGAPPNAAPLQVGPRGPYLSQRGWMEGEEITAPAELREHARAFHQRTLAMHARGASRATDARGGASHAMLTRGRARQDPWAPWRRCVMDAVGRIQDATPGLRHAPRAGHSSQALGDVST